jgi:fermentation-respiration switch protein FrsA (DUF1100 family)
VNAPKIATRSIWKRRIFIRVIGYPVVGAVAVIGTLSFFENSLVYFPTTAKEHWIEPSDLPHQDVALSLLDGTPIHAWWCQKNGAKGALIFCHGNGGNLSFRAEEYRLLRDRLNVSVLAFDYPGYGKSGGKPSEKGCYESAEAAFDWLVGQGVPAERVVLFGESLGGGVATELATRKPCRALVLYSTFTSVPDVGRIQYPFLPTHLLMRNRFETERKLAGVNRPVFVSHGDADRLIPIEQARRLFEAAVGPKELLIDAGRVHELDLTPKFLKALDDFLSKNAP